MQNVGDAGQSIAAIARAFPNVRQVASRQAATTLAPGVVVQLGEDDPGPSLPDDVASLKALHTEGHPHAHTHAPPNSAQHFDHPDNPEG